MTCAEGTRTQELLGPDSLCGINLFDLVSISFHVGDFLEGEQHHPSIPRHGPVALGDGLLMALPVE